ncbi:phosphatidylglycerol lysyltransferase domain-containing protein [Caulobacter sp. 17J80-11]|uniref:phosphatidylglycerol lysyltransferase domain-containing protein n=1 Tax=Caulobacter sp. 17J80-11 TaxID=2763502 RepID=UPI001653BA21|nr:phosphatidylglycerol lysyltransferase domain-containing protein [Caulobacter sp. 17J80-11]MBC6980138.1 bifunctional lysylphosphatidylglycerol flippase/synthetase MprF [Caulobacter sp. 17J80-11]
MRLIREYRPAFLAVAPTLTAIFTLAAGVMLMASGATPSPVERFAWLLRQLPPEVINLGHFVSSLLGLVLVLLAWGLKRRLDGAWAASVTVAVVAGVVTLLKGVNWEETAVLVALVAFLLVARPAFTRHAAVSRMEITPGWMVSAALLVAGMGLLAWWSFKHVAYSDDLWWRVMADASGEAGRALRATVGAGVLLLALGVWRLAATPATPPIMGENDPDFTRVRAVLATAEDASPDANLALLGDKRFLFSDSGKSFLMFGVRGHSWIAVGGPVGLRSERAELMWRFREMADAHAARPGFYNVGADLLPDFIDMGFSLQKIGESAIMPLADFSVAGRRRGNLRHSWKKVAEAGASFEVIPAEAVAPLMPELKQISDAWLDMHAGGEKGFSLGGFDPRYLSEFPCALVRQNDRVVAFASLWPTAERSSLAMDLMRYTEDAPRNVMDYLFVELLLWAQNEGYTVFEFGGAPLAGLSDHPLAPTMSRIGRFVFEKGEDFYNFQGVRRFKDKYDPLWQPRYVAAARKWAIPLLMADVALLSSGGVAGLARRPKPKEAPKEGERVSAPS